MKLSLNEVEMTMRKAARGTGLALGLAEDLGRAAAWLARVGQDGTGLGLAGLESTQVGGQGQVFPDGLVQFDAARVVRDCPSALDFLVASGDPVHMTDVDVPGLVAGLAGVVATEHYLRITLACAGHGDLIVEAGGLIGVLPMDRVDIVLTCEAAEKVETPTSPTKDITARADVWERLSALAFKTYVPESEASRLAGAGAGLLDND